MKKHLTLLVTIVFVCFLIGPRRVVTASQAYNYTPLENVIESASSMSVSTVIDNSNLIDVNGDPAPIKLGSLNDVFVYKDYIYVSDASSNLIYQFNSQFQFTGTFPEQKADEELPEDYKLNKPNGLFARDNSLYVADTENERIVIFDIDTKEIITTVSNPADPTFDKIKFKPLKIAVDRTGRMFVIAFDVFEGIMDFNPDGSFSRFYGTNKITMDFFEALVYRFSTEKQRAKQALKLQTSFLNLDIDEYGYVYTVSRPDVNDLIKKINFKGNDVLNKNGYVNPVGDVVYQNYNDTVPRGRSNLVDIAVSPDGNMYSALDDKRGRIFTYDNEGNLLYVFGQKGSQSTMFTNPKSLTYLNDKVIVIDSMTHSITVFEPTTFGRLINEATNLYLSAQYAEAKTIWEEVIVLNSNYFLAYNGIGKAQLRDGDFQNALVNLRLGNDHYNYSKAYEQHRNARLSKVLPYVLVTGFVVLGYLFVQSLRQSVARENEGDE